jgi:hypothetical protein
MKWTVTYDEENDYVRVTTEGVFNVTDHLEMIEDILSRDFWRPGMAAFFDHRLLDFGESTFEIMMEASANHTANDDRIGSGKAAILMKTIADFGIGRQFQSIAGDNISALLHIFTNEEKAHRWIIS